LSRAAALALHETPGNDPLLVPVRNDAPADPSSALAELQILPGRQPGFPEITGLA